MNENHRLAQRLIASSLLLSLLGLSACGKNREEPGQPAPADASAAGAATTASIAQAASATPVAYTPPGADQLYQMVAPIALFPDKLVALVLAGSTYPDQIAAANTWLAQNPNLKGQALVTSADQQSWDPSVKALTAFPAVLSQMATNIAWTTTLGQAYYNDPTDVLNAIQVMRQRAQASGNLCTTGEIRVTRARRSSAPADQTPAPSATPVYEGPAIIPPPPQTIVIAPAQPDVVYVPVYNPAVVYGAPVAAYPGYLYRPPVYGPGAVVTAGVITFGVGVAIGAVFGHVGWGWHAWGMHWGGSPHGARDGWQRPAVVYNNNTYISRSTTVINRISNTHISDNYNGTVSRSLVRNGAPQQPAMAQMHAQQPGFGTRSSTPMTIPRFRPNDARPGTHSSPQFVPNHSSAVAMEHTRTSVTHGNPVTTQTRSQGHLEDSMQVEHQQVPHPTSQYAEHLGRERQAEAPDHPPQPQAVQHRENAEPHLQAVREDATQVHPAGLRQDGQHFTHPQSQQQPLRTQPHPPAPAPHPSAPRPEAHHGEPQQHRP